MNAKRGLGRGLEALIPTGDEHELSALQEVPLDLIEPNPHQPRMPIDETELAELAASIQEHGIIQPLVVNRRPEGGYHLIAGERRWRASRLAGLTTVPIIIKEVAPQQMLELALVENIQRADLNALEEALAYQHLVEDFGLSQQEVAQRVGKSRVAVTNTLRLLQAATGVKDALISGQISEGHARAIISLESTTDQETALAYVIEHDLTVRQTEALIQQLREGKPPSPPAEPPSPDLQALENRFQESLGTKVQLKPGRKGGRVVIYYYSDEEFQALYQRLTGEEL